MKKQHRTVIGALLSAFMLANIPLSALSYTGLGDIVSIKRDTVGGGLAYSELVSKTDDDKAQKAYIFEYTPGTGTLPLVRYGSTVYGKDRLGTLVSAETDLGGIVFGAVNGDFYSMQTGVPLGVMIDGGELVSSDDSKYAVGFTKDNKAIVGKPAISVSVTNGTRKLPPIKIDHINKYPTVWGIYMVTDDFSSTTLSAAESLEIIVNLDGQLTASCSVTGTVIEVVTDDMNSGIPEGCAVITVAEDSQRYAELSGMFAVGDKLTFDITCAEGWENVITAIGGGDLVLDDGAMPEGTVDEDHEKASNPRTAIVIKEDGTVVVFAVDGRTQTSKGMNETDLSALMAELGCVKALNLDGGGSTSVMVKASDSQDCIYVNTPSEGSFRSVANGLLFVSEFQSDGEAAALSVSPNTPYLLRASTVDFTASVLDKAYKPTGTELQGDVLTASFKEEYPNDIGSVANNSFTAGLVPGEYKLSLSNGSISGDVSVIVTDKLHGLGVSPEYTKVKPGSLVKIDIDAIYNDREIVATPSSFYYTLNGTHVIPDQKDYPGAMLLCDLGYLDMNGNFQSFYGEYEGTVEIGVWFDEFVRYVTVNVGTGPDYIADFESVEHLGRFKISTTGDELYIAAAESGFKSENALEFGFTYNTNTRAKLADVKLREYIPMSTDAESIKLWAKGDVSGIVTATVMDGDGKTYDVSYAVTKDYSKQTGWRELTATIPESLKTGTLYLTSLMSISDMGKASRVIAIDDPIIFYGEYAKNKMTGIEGHWAENSIYTLYDMGVILDNDCEPTDNNLLRYTPDAALTRGEFAKMITLWSGVVSQNYNTEGITPEEGTPTDKIPYIRAAIDHGLMSGRGVLENGTVVFDANATITREEAFKFIGTIITASESDISFTDADSISDWAKSGVAECVGAGIVSGYGDNTIRPKATITRAELATILGRMS